MSGLKSVQLGHMKHDTAAVTLGTKEAGKAVCASQLQLRDALRYLPDRPGPDLDRDPALRAELDDFGFMLQAQVERGQSCRGESQRSALDDRRRQGQPVRQAEASCGARRDSSRSTVFIITEGVVFHVTELA